MASASHDLSARLTQVSISADSPSGSARTVASLHLHTGALTSISASRAGKHLLTTSHDGLIGFWDTIAPNTDEVPLDEPQVTGERKKRRKIANDDERPKRKAPLAVLKSHTGQVSKAVFVGSSNREAVSAGFDSTVRTWDTENGICTRTIVSRYSFSDSISNMPTK